MKKWFIAGVVVVAEAISSTHDASAGVRRFLMFGGGNTDTTEQASIWIPVRGAYRVVLKTWSTHSGTYTGADSTRTDSVTTFKVCMSDSVGGTITDLQGQTLNFAADSVMIDFGAQASQIDTNRVCITAHPLPINRTLRAPANGTGLVTVIRPTSFLNGGGGDIADGVFVKDYLRVRLLPLTRMTPAGTNSTAGIRTAGLKGFKMVADVYYDNSTPLDMP